MTANEDRDRRIMAGASFRRLMIYILLAGVLMVIGALFFLSLFSALTVHMVVATSVGVFLSVLLGSGLMAAGFFSSNSGHDERATGHGRQADPSDGDPENG